MLHELRTTGGACLASLRRSLGCSLAGIAVLSGYLVLPNAFEAERHAANQRTPLLWCHGQMDPVVSFSMSRQGSEQVRSAGYEVEFHAYPMAHSMCLPEVIDLRDWLRARFAE